MNQEIKIGQYWKNIEAGDWRSPIRIDKINYYTGWAKALFKDLGYEFNIN